MKFEPMAIDDVVLVKPQVFGDDRGFFLETYHSEKFFDAGIDMPFVQDNMSKSGRFTLRGLHYQIHQPQGKLVRALEGEIFDVAVDLRRGSSNFGKWVGATLSADNQHALWVPPGFAHGFLVTSETAVVAYKCTDLYAPEHERSIRWNDPDVGINWPLPHDSEPMLSAKDADAVSFKEADTYQ